MVAVKASKMESSSNYQEWKEDELDEVLVKITENDDDFCIRGSQQCVRSPDSGWTRGVASGQTPGGSRRGSVWSTISMIKSKLGGKSNTSFENIREEKFWELLSSNNNTVNNNNDGNSNIQVHLNEANTKKFV